MIEFVRAKDDRFLGPFTIAQLMSVVLVAIGIVLLQRFSRGTDVDPGPYLRNTSPTRA